MNAAAMIPAADCVDAMADTIRAYPLEKRRWMALRIAALICGADTIGRLIFAMIDLEHPRSTEDDLLRAADDFRDCASELADEAEGRAQFSS